MTHSPEDLKQALEACCKPNAHRECPYREYDSTGALGCLNAMLKDALEYIRQLEKEVP